MKDNVTKVIERGDRLEDLQDKSGMMKEHKVNLLILIFDMIWFNLIY